MSQSRQLAAIMFTDIVGYTALMGDDEQRAFTILNKNRALQKPIIDQFNGRLIKELGDGIMASFNTVSDAVNAAIKIQEACNAAKDFQLRIGIHQGEIVFEAGDIFGDAVNIASRIQTLGAPGSILFSKNVNDEIKNKPEFKSASLGSFEFKNVKEPIEVFALVREGIFFPHKSEMKGKMKEKNSINKVSFQNKSIVASAIIVLLIIATAFFIYKRFSNQSVIEKEKSIAVLPFKNESSNKDENEPFCNGVTLEVLKNLTWMNELQPIAPQSMEKYRETKMSIADIARELGVKFIVQGSVQRYNNEVKVFAALIDAETGKQIWADDFPGQMENIFTLQENIAQKIASALRIKITPEEKSRMGRVATKNTKALDFYNEAVNDYVKLVYTFVPTYLEEGISMNASTYTSYLRILSLCDQALALDSNMAEAYALKGKTYFYKYSNRPVKGRSQIPALSLLDTIFNLGRKSLAIDENAVDGYILLSKYYAEKGNDSSLYNLQKALAINPNSFDVNLELGEFYRFADDEKSLRFLYKALRLDPLSVWTPQVYLKMADAYLDLCDFEKSESYCKKALGLSDKTSTTAEALFWIDNVYLHWPKPDSVIKYSTQLLALNDSNALYQLAEAYCYLKNDCNKAAQLYEELWNKFHQEHVNEHRWAIALWKTGKKGRAEQLLNKSFEWYKKVHPLGYDLAGMYAFKGDKVNAYRILKQFDWQWGSPNFIQFDPLFENLWNDKEFKDLVKEALDKKAKLRERIRTLQEKGEF